ncbi:hypothetical protein SARC_04031 [Sphaeroforma arctica JP610]|uniref:WD repeat-containing protein 74 n=1 Tax=Sphaeroforma arctica JP610 TaxID=667725 RepID=A0A0L0G4I9_9EUKA|nr:hypothetical protein SARC_04031 [Sphaeroforma arctica JP610]KNC83726.1 hypothetical protein SARC_04031 [Sphaeroforma arctica JP610]|eukprot:XP_014157628.1 hypothetical protein SARC_04031 [Sphaeroforma arctica JP610]
MKLWIGDETGQLKGVSVEEKKIESRYLTLARDNEIAFMSFGPGSTDVIRSENILCGLKHAGKVNVHSHEDGEILKTFTAPPGEMVGMSVLDGDSDDTSKCRVMIACKESDTKGCVQYINWDDSKVVYERAFEENLGCVRVSNENTNIYATGGKDNNLKIYNINKEQAIFKAKNLPNDMTDLQVPVWIRDISFVPGSDATKVVAGTGHYEIQYYDTKVKKRPVLHQTVSEHPIMSVAVTSDAKSVVFGTAAGETKRLSLESGEVLNAYKGASGSVRCVQVHPALPYVASCGLDRYAKVHHIETGRLVAKVYMKTKLNALLFYGEEKREEKGNSEKANKRVRSTGDGDNEGSSADEETDVWDELEEVVEKDDDDLGKTASPKPKKKAKKN